MARKPSKSKRIRIFESSIERLARILANKWKDLRVVFKHGECKTDGSTIFLPVLPDNAPQELMDAMQGHLDHEASHVVNTDFKVFNSCKRRPKLLTTVNAMEDPRIEDKWKKIYPGARVNLKRSQDWSLRRVAEEHEVEDENGNKVMQKPWDGLSDFGKFLFVSCAYACEDFDDTYWFFNDVVEPEVMKEVRKHSDLFRKAKEANDTGEVKVLAQELLDVLGEDDPEIEEVNPEDIEDDAIVLPPGAGPSPQDQVMNKQKERDPNAPKVYQAVMGEGEGQPQQGEGQEEGGQPGGEDSDAENSGSGGANYDPTDEELANDEKLTSKYEMLQAAADREVTGQDDYLVYTTEGDKIERIDGEDRVAYKDFMRDATRIVSPMKRRLARSLLSTNVSRWDNDKLRGKINPRSIYKVGLGTSKRVFRQKVEAESFDTAVLLMVDHSGSMRGSQLRLAAQTSIVFGELLHQLGIPFAVMGFSTGNGQEGYQRQQQASAAERKVYKRWGNLWIGEYKSFEDPWSRAGSRIITMPQHGKINTYDGESLRYGAQVLLNRPEKRKILFWMNDGYPCPNGADDTSAHWEYAHACAAEVEKKVELFALGINAPDVARIYSNCVIVNDIQDLPKTCLLELDAMLRKGKSLRTKAA